MGKNKANKYLETNQNKYYNIPIKYIFFLFLRLNMKIKELRLLNITIKQNGNTIYQGKTEEIPEELKEQNYSKIYFKGVDIIVEI